MSIDDGNTTVLVVDDEVGICNLMKRFLESKGYKVNTAVNAEQALDFISTFNYDIIITDFMLPDLNGLELTRKLKEKKYPAEILLISGYGTVEEAVEAIKLGAYDFLLKPIDLQKLHVSVANALQKRSLEQKVAKLDTSKLKQNGFTALIGSAPSFMDAIALANKVAFSDVNILISGESGTGKEVFARAIHRSGTRKEGPFIAVNCGAIPENLMESELFGSEKGAYTGASAKRAGYFEAANGGTIFLDEISEMPHFLQVKLLRTVQDRVFARLGSTKNQKTDCRIICASNKNLEEEVKKGNFREDLFFRINVIEIKLPPLRERKPDIPQLTDYFLKKYSGRTIKLDEAVMNAFVRYPWPGNVRELENVIQRAIILAGGDTITIDLLPENIIHNNGGNALKPSDIKTGVGFKQTQQRITEDYEKVFVTEILSRNNGNVMKSAMQAGVSRQTLHRMMKKHGIHSYDFKN